MSAEQKEGTTRHAILMALARADGQMWESMAEANEHTAEVMYGKQADAVQQLIDERLVALARSRPFARAEAAERELRQRELHHFETEQENAKLWAAIDRVLELCTRWDGWTKGPSPTTIAIREAVKGVADARSRRA